MRSCRQASSLDSMRCIIPPPRPKRKTKEQKYQGCRFTGPTCINTLTEKLPPDAAIVHVVLQELFPVWSCLIVVQGRQITSGGSTGTPALLRGFRRPSRPRCVDMGVQVSCMTLSDPGTATLTSRLYLRYNR